MTDRNERAVLFVPDGEETEKALSRTTHLAVAAHQDDIEFMAYAPCADCYGRKDRWFSGVVVTDGAGSPRTGVYADCTDEDMKRIRAEEQKRASAVGGYGFMALLGYPSSAVKNPETAGDAERDLREILLAARPRYVYMHNFADKHETHVAVAARTLQALRSLPEDARPEKVYGCEVWRDLDWLCDSEKVYLDAGRYPNLARSLSGVFDSQISGGKRYDLAAEGRRVANATFSESHATDTYAGLNYAMDLTPLVLDSSLDAAEFVCAAIERFESEVRRTAGKFFF